MPFIQIHMLTGRTDDQKRDLLSGVTDAVEQALGAPRDSIRVWIEEFPPEHFNKTALD